jgi:DNA uptake protein ComE-like DNA-binding protein
VCGSTSRSNVVEKSRSEQCDKLSINSRYCGWSSTQPRSIRSSESGALLIIVLWVAFGLVAITLYFAHSMNQELRASDNRAANIAASQAIAGAARYLSNYLGTVAIAGEIPQPEDFECEAIAVGQCKYWMIGRDTNDWEINLSVPAFGLVDEGSKLNLNAPWLTAEAIQYLPGMTPQIAAAIMDWRDANSTVTTDGAEDETYTKLDYSYRAKNATFESVDELRLVNGVTPEILYGEDANLNGILDANENDSDESAPTDNRDGRLDFGLMEYFTTYTYEPTTVGTNVTSRINVQALLTEVLPARANEIMAQPGMSANQFATITSPLGLYLSSGMTEDEFALVAEHLAAITNQTVNVNTASEAVLECIPGIGTTHAAQLVSFRESNPSRLGTVAWVFYAMAEDEAAAREAGPYITTRTHQFTADIAAVGPFNRGYQRVRYVFDTSEGAPKVIRRQDLTHLGWALGKETRTELLAARKELR